MVKSPVEQLSMAIRFATEKHEGQFDKAGMPYILHPLKVMHYLKSDDPELMAAAVLHDVAEDCYKDPEVCYGVMREMGFSERVIDAVRGVTKVKGETEEEKLARITKTPDRIKVKKADLRHNMDPRRMKGVSEKDRVRNDAYSRLYWAIKDLA